MLTILSLLTHACGTYLHLLRTLEKKLQTFHQKRCMDDKHMKIYSTSLISKEMQIKITVSYHCIPIRTAKIKTTDHNKYQQGCRETGTLRHYCWKCKMAKPLWETDQQFLKKLNTLLLYDPAIPLLGIS